MSYAVVVPNSVRKQILKLPASVSDSILSRLSVLEANPRPVGSLKLRGSDGWRIRVGDCRIIDDKRKIVVIRKVGHRREIYR